MKEFLTTKRTFILVVFLGLFAMAARNVTDPDVWWHLKTGQYILEQGNVPHTDPFSFTRLGEPWVAHEWLTDLLFFGVFRASGWTGLILFSAAVLSVAFFPLYLRCEGRPYLAGVLALAAAWATAPLWGVRPQVISLVLGSLWLLLLERSEQKPGLLLWTLPLTLLWVNLHAGFALGLVLLFLFVIGELIEGILASASLPAHRLRLLALILVADLLIVPLNPNGLRMYSYPIQTLRSPAMQSYIVEWASPNFHRQEYWPFLFLLLAVLAALAGISRSIRLRDLLLLIVATYAALCSIRMIPLFVLIAIPLLSVRLESLKPAQVATSRLVHPPPPNRTMLNAVIILGVALFAIFHTFRVAQLQPQGEGRQFPAEAVAFLQDHLPVKRLFNDYDWGGYLIWKLYPPTRVFIDGRADVYGDKFLEQYWNDYQLKDAWRENLSAWGIQAVIIPPDSSLATGLRLSPQWQIAYQDRKAIVLVVNPPAVDRRNGQQPQVVPSPPK